MERIEEYLHEDKIDEKSTRKSGLSRFFWLFSFLAALSAVALWYSIPLSMGVMEPSRWLIPVAFFVLCIAFFNLSVTLAERFIRILPVVSLLIFSGLFFVPSKFAAIGAVAAFLFLMLAARRIRQDIEGSVRLSLWKSWRMARAMTIVSFAVLIGAMYFGLVERHGIDNILPRVGPNDLVTEYAIRLADFLNPEMMLTKDRNATIDELILSSIESQQGNGLVPDGIKNLSATQRQQIVSEGHKQFAKFLGREVDGGERASELMSEVINRKIRNLYRVDYPQGSFGGYLPGILALVTFLTVLSIGPVLVSLAAGLALIIFKILVKTGSVRIENISVEQEIIV